MLSHAGCVAQAGNVFWRDEAALCRRVAIPPVETPPSGIGRFVPRPNSGRTLKNEGAANAHVTTEDDCLRALHEAAERLDESPTKAQYEGLGLTPSASTILRHCGGWNAAKERAGLETNASRGSRVQPKPAHVDLPDGLVWDELSQDQRWHYSHREASAKKSRRWRACLRAWVREEKATSDGCVRCGESDVACLDFHHLDDVEKDLAVNEMVLMGRAKDAIRAEIERCELLCTNCHWREHNADPAGVEAVDDIGGNGRVTGDDVPDSDDLGLTKHERLRAWSYAYQRDRGCRECGETDPRCLQFHHTDGEKDDAVGSMIADSRAVGDVVAEVRKCLVLCANCHRRVHDNGSTD